VAAAIVAGLGGSASLERSLARTWRVRDATLGPMSDFTAELAALRGPLRADRRVLRSVGDRPEEVQWLLGVFSGVVPLRRYRSVGSVRRLVGWAGLAGLAVDRLRDRFA
jgi:hypothetical protein